MSAILVLILRILLVIFLYAFLGFAFVVLWREMKKASNQQNSLRKMRISIEINNKEKKDYQQTEIWIGRGAENDIQFKDETISHQHARIFFYQNNWMVEDRNSTNGTFLNGEMITSPIVLVNGDEIRIGNHQLNVLIHNEF